MKLNNHILIGRITQTTILISVQHFKIAQTKYIVHCIFFLLSKLDINTHVMQTHVLYECLYIIQFKKKILNT